MVAVGATHVIRGRDGRPTSAASMTRRTRSPVHHPDRHWPAARRAAGAVVERLQRGSRNVGRCGKVVRVTGKGLVSDDQAKDHSGPPHQRVAAIRHRDACCPVRPAVLRGARSISTVCAWYHWRHRSESWRPCPRHPSHDDIVRNRSRRVHRRYDCCSRLRSLGRGIIAKSS